MLSAFKRTILAGVPIFGMTGGMLENLFLIAALIFVIAVVMTMVGKGGGNFYVVVLALASIPMYEAAATGQFILFAASMAALFVFQKNKTVSWPLVLLIGGFTSLSAFGGGFLSHHFSGLSLKIIFGILLVASGIIMLVLIKTKTSQEKKPGYIRIQLQNEGYFLNMWIVVPVTILTGFASGMVGVSGGSFLVPLMVLACGVPMHVAVGTSSTLIAATALMGFAGHAIQGDFNPMLALPLAVVTILGGVIGGKLALQSKPKNLKQIFAVTNFIAAAFMVVNLLNG